MKILAVGGSGFIGSHVIRKLLSEGHTVTNIDNMSKYGFIEHDFYTNPRFKLIVKDIREVYPSYFSGYDVVLFFAALIGGINYFHKYPYQIARDNTEMMVKAIDNTLAASPGAVFYYFSSSMVYERAKKPVSEKDALNQLVPITNYGMQKLFGEFIVRGANQEYGLNYVIVRPFNAVGSGELPKLDSKGELEFGMAHVIPDFVYKSIKKQDPFEILGDGTQVRTFTHVNDIADAVSAMIKLKVKNQDFNICGGRINTVTVLDLAKKIWKRVNPKLDFPRIKKLSAPKDDVKFRVGVSNKAKSILNWSPKYDIDEIIDDSFNFIKDNIDSIKRS